MNGEKTDILDDLVEDMVDECYDPSNYDPDEFYDDATEFLSVYGYNLRNETIWEFHEDDPVEEIESNHLEVISELDDRGDKVYLRFVLEDGRPENEPPTIDQVNGPEEFEVQLEYEE